MREGTNKTVFGRKKIKHARILRVRTWFILGDRVERYMWSMCLFKSEAPRPCRLHAYPSVLALLHRTNRKLGHV